MANLLSKPSEISSDIPIGNYEKFNLSENPFPSEPTVNKESTDKRINGYIYEMEIRGNEYELILSNFIRKSQKDPNHLRLGYIIDTSYIGRGNGKSAFLLNLTHKINREYCLDLSNNINRCFAIYVSPEPGGRTKTFPSFVDTIFESILNSGIINICLATLRLEVINQSYPEISLAEFPEDELIMNLNSKDWFDQEKIDYRKIHDIFIRKESFQNLPFEFPLFGEGKSLFSIVSTQDDFKQYYRGLKKTKERIDFLFNDLIKLFIAANFNGAYVFIDDFERIPDFQSSRQKKDFALELRTCLFDGISLNAKLGFYNMFLVLHAGVPRLINDAWAASGMENRAPINQLSYKHIIVFDKLTRDHVALLLKKYLSEYRIKEISKDQLYPFTEDAVNTIGEMSEFNAAKILKMAYEYLEKAVEKKSQQVIDNSFISDYKDIYEMDDETHTLDVSETLDLMKKANE